MEGVREKEREREIERKVLLLRVVFLQPDNSIAQYVLRMMINQHKFYVSELEGTPGISWMKDG